MSSKSLIRAGWLCALLAGPALAQDPIGPDGAQVLTRGPVHESFAQPVVYDPRPGPVIPKEPPPPIEELPPDQKPEGTNVRWIPGYWAFDDDRRDYLWVSGVWRNIPPGRDWVPGYWHEADGGFRWAPGVWMASQPQGQAPGQGGPSYLPAPPASLESGPNAPAPMPDAVWAPGCWAWEDGRYYWRPGFWVAPQPNWVWIPAQYAWTPAGYLFCPGYWDRPLASRGQLFAPVYFPEPVYAQPAYVYQPSIGIVATALLGSLFVRPSVNIYVFGDYYAPTYFSAGIYPAYAFHQSRFGYDPLFSYYSVSYRGTNPAWGMQVREAYLYRRDHVDARPPRTFVEMNRVNVTNITVNNINVVNRTQNLAFAQPIGRIAAGGNPAAGAMRFERVEAAQQRVIAAQSREIRQFQQERVRSEVAVSHQQVQGQAFRPRPMELPRSPVAHAPAAFAHASALAPHHATPSMPAHPEVDRAVPHPVAQPAHAGVRPEPHPEVHHDPVRQSVAPRPAPAPPRGHADARREPTREERRPRK